MHFIFRFAALANEVRTTTTAAIVSLPLLHAFKPQAAPPTTRPPRAFGGVGAIEGFRGVAENVLAP